MNILRILFDRLFLVFCFSITVLPFALHSDASGRGQRIFRQPDKNENSGLIFRLSEGKEESQPQPRLDAPRADILSDDAAQALLKRLPPIKSEDGDEQDFAMRDRSLPAPRAGQTINEAFPPVERATLPDQPSSGPLEILRFAPEGEVPIAPHLSVTFSQPMVPLTSNSDLAALDAPVKLSPQPKGRWRWIGTKTLLFEPEGRFPMATNYTVEIPAGTRSLNGGALAAAKRWTFATPPLQIKAKYPEGAPHPRNPVIFIEFDQRIEREDLLKYIELRSSNRETKLRLATAEEVAADENARRLAEEAACKADNANNANNANNDCWIALRATGGEPDKPLATGTHYTVTIRKGAPSSEGSRVTASPLGFDFDTYGRLKLLSYRCGFGEGCEPGHPWVLQFNNQLDLKAFDQSQIRVEPEVPGLRVNNYGQMISLEGATKGRITYKVTLDASLRDVFGQTLGENETITFKVGPASPNIAPAAETMAVLDPFAAPRFSIFSINHSQLKVSLYSVGPEHFGRFKASARSMMQNRYQRGRQQPSMPAIGRLVYTKVVDIANKPDDLVETAIDLKPALNDGFGQMILNVEAIQPPKHEWERRSFQVWIQATNLGLDAFVDQTNLLGWATSLKDGKPLGDVQMKIVAENAGAGMDAAVATGRDGLARLELPNTKIQKLLIASKGKDLAILPEDLNWWSDQSSWENRGLHDSLCWHVFDDRGMYKPGEEVHLKGWLRRLGAGPKGDVGMFNGIEKVSYTLKDSRGNEVLKGSAPLNATGGFDLAFKLPPTMNLGSGMLELTAPVASGVDGNQYYHSFSVQEFRRPDYEVKTTASQGPYFVGSYANLTAAASYYAGGGLPNADVRWQVTATPTTYTPPNRGEFIFGKWIPWWRYNSPGGSAKTKEFAGSTDAAGKHYLRVDFDSVDPAAPTSVVAFANVTDVNRQNFGGSVNLLVHPSELYVGIRSSRLFVQKGEPIFVESIVSDLDGKLVAGREIRMRASLIDWVYEKGEWKERETSPQDCVIKSGNDPVKCRFESREGGVYRIGASVIDDRERRNESEMTVWVAGGKQPPQRELAQEKIELIPDRKEYQAGETAEILVQAPFFPAEGIVTFRRSGLATSERFTLTSGSHTLKIPITDDLAPNVHVQVDLAGASLRTDSEGKADAKSPKRPAFASGTLDLSVPPLKRKLAVTATPRDKETEPGAETFVDIELRDAGGKPVSGGEAALVVVDEAVLALSNYKLADPIKTFYAPRGDEVRNHYLRGYLQLAKSDGLISQMQQSGGPQDLASKPLSMMVTKSGRVSDLRILSRSAAMAMEKAGDAAEPIRNRIDFNALAAFVPSITADAGGRASVKLKLPDNLTRYRVMVVAVAGEKQFGSAESSITARLPLMVRPSAPRFLNFGDKIELPVVVQNQTGGPMQVELAMRATNAQLTAGQGRRVTVPANDRVEVRFPAAAVKPGTARFQIVGASGRWSDAAEVSLPVWTPATTEAFATYGEVDAGALIQPVKAPSDAIRQFGGLEVTTSSTQLQALTDAMIYLTSYPYECTEQVASRVLAIAALRDVLAAFDAKGLPKADDLIASVKRDLERLRGLQNEDGGFGFWRRGESIWPYLGIHVAHTLQRAKEKGFDVPPEMLEKSKEYLRTIEQHIPDWYDLESRRVLIAYSLYVRNRMNDRDQGRARRLIAEAGGVEKLPLEALGWLLPVLSGNGGSQSEAAAIRRHFANRAEETAAAAHFTASYKDGAHLLLASSRRADAVILEALIGDDPRNDLIPKIVRGLLDHRQAGRWESTQENAFVLLALDRYFAVYEKATPDFVARAWLGVAYAGQHEFRGRTTERSQINVPMRYLSGAGQNLVLSKEGTGRLYYRLGMSYAPENLQLKPADYGFTVTRVYEAIDNPNDVRREEDGTWRIKAGAKVRVRLTMVAPARRYHVALVDPLPAGLEAQNPSLATTGPIPQDPQEQSAGSWWWWRRPWFEHQNMRDERVEAFASLLWEGVHNYSYVARATTPGVFVVPPAKAEEMYHPETYGRGGTDRVVIE